MDCVKCHGTGWCAQETLGVQEQWMCERCNGSGEEPFKPRFTYRNAEEAEIGSEEYDAIQKMRLERLLRDYPI